MSSSATPSRREFLGTAALATGALACPRIGAAADRPPNIVLIISDDQAWGDYGFMGHPAIKTPRLDKLASESVVFTRGYVTAPLCCPSLASMVTGLYPHQHKITSNDPPSLAGTRGWGPERLKLRFQVHDHLDRVATLPRMLAKKGYLSHQSGKWWLGHYSRGGFTHGMTHGDPKRGGRHGDAGLTIGRQSMKPITDFLDAAGEKPFFIWYAPFLPHSPHNPPERLLAKYKDKTESIHIARYWAMCEWFDETCGQLLDALDKRGLRDNTLVLYVCDNGWIQLPKSGGSDPRSKRSRFDGGIRTPIMVRWPGKAKPRRDETTPVSSIDLATTALAAAGLEPAKGMQGLNLLDTKALAARNAVFGGVYTHDAADVNDPTKNLMWRWCVSGWWKLCLPNAPLTPNAAPELYNLEADPFEKTNLAAKHPDKVKELTQSIEGWYKPGTPAPA